MNVLLRTILTLLVVSRTPAFATNQPVTQDQQNSKQTQNQVNPNLFKHSLSGLYGIQSFSDNPEQPYSDFDSLYSNARVAQTELETISKSIALQTSSQMLTAGIKSEERAKAKIASDLSSNVSKITDLARTTIVADDIQSLVTTFELLERQAKIVSVKNRFKSPVASGYRDLNVLVELPNSQIIAEVQLHLSEIARVKNGPEHDLYEQIQDIERNALVNNREMSELEKAKIESLRKESIDLYNNAWQPYITTNLQAA